MSKAALFLRMVIDYYINGQFGIYLKKEVVKLNLFYLKSTFMYIVLAAPMQSNTLFQHCFPVLNCENSGSRGSSHSIFFSNSFQLF